MLSDDQLADIETRRQLWTAGDRAALETVVDNGPGADTVPQWYLDLLTLLTDAADARDEIRHLKSLLRIANGLNR